MDQDTESIIYRIIAGYYCITIDNTQYKIVLPRLSLKDRAHRLYLSILDDNKFDTSSWVTPKVISNLLEKYDIWTSNKDDELTKLLESIDSTKIQLYLNFNNEQLKTEIKEILEQLNSQLNSIYTKKYYFDYLTLEYYAQNIKNQYLIINMIYNLDDTQVFNYNNFDDIDSVKLEKFLVEIHKNSLDTDTIKKIARHDIWKSFWNISKDNIFHGLVQDWTDEQRSLVSFSKVIDSIREHMEAPSEDVINDNDALDGWILYQNDKIEKEKKKKQISDRYDLENKKGNEIFILTKDKEESRTIFGLNDNQTKKDIRTANKLVDEKGTVKETELPHIKRELNNRFNNMARERIKSI